MKESQISIGAQWLLLCIGSCIEELRVAKFSQDWYLYYFQSHHANTLAINSLLMGLFVSSLFSFQSKGIKFHYCNHVFNHVYAIHKFSRDFLLPKRSTSISLARHSKPSIIALHICPLVSLQIISTNSSLVSPVHSIYYKHNFRKFPQSLSVNQPGNAFSLPTYILPFQNPNSNSMSSENYFLLQPEVFYLAHNFF